MVPALPLMNLTASSIRFSVAAVPVAIPMETALGLVIAKRTVDAHRGTVRASNLSSGGLRVDISLPSEVTH